MMAERERESEDDGLNSVLKKRAQQMDNA